MDLNKSCNLKFILILKRTNNPVWYLLPLEFHADSCNLMIYSEICFEISLPFQQMRHRNWHVHQFYQMHMQKKYPLTPDIL